MEQAEYCQPDRRVLGAHVPGDPRLFLVALVVTLLGFPIIALDALGSSGPSDSVVIEAAAYGEPLPGPLPSEPRVIQALSDGDERIEAAYEQTRSEIEAQQSAAEADYEAAVDDDPAPVADEAAPATTPTTAAPAPTTTAPPAPAPAPASSSAGGDVWQRLAQCESGGNWAHTGSYHGGLQFHPSTWVAFGGQEFATYAYQATAQQQIIVAERVRAADGGSFRAWPGCRRKLGLP